MTWLLFTSGRGPAECRIALAVGIRIFARDKSDTWCSGPTA
jgi:hypothetical protein